MEKSDKHIIKQIRKGDKTAFEHLFKTHYNELCNFANSFVKDPDEAEEIVQDVFYKLWQKRKQLIIQKNLRGYLFKTIRNKCTAYGRHLKIKQQYEQDPNTSHTPESPLELLEATQMENLFNQTLMQLPERCRKIFNLSREQGLKYREIAIELSISIKTVEADMGSTLKALREALKTAQK
ncbi:RNA polymerase sigma factor CnrH [Salinivirga cyanobacteriivorans]|uniref:RNA polymerase sigma factor CnrH n=1 Tax=Salinivirga cyanobacteriivorans TaxID=1307839 RepID=A0A0S2I2F5_9BACT|nr:RNA polymerase sigma-70 factor [Salinivirga cyanobacteriivorans]ALO16611.1 RNA polymerase sigma factor CnrH [Salinivirga cyanobacteriivorans]